MSWQAKMRVQRGIHPEWLVPDWDAPPRVRAFVTTRAGGVSKGAYATMNAKLRWTHRASARGHALSLFAECRNLLDREYATRGIYAFDFGTFSNAVFVTPAPGRRVFAGLEWRL